MHFAKYHGLGNDFILVWGEEHFPKDPARAARTLCARHAGIGADGLVLLCPSRKKGTDISFRIFNSDGSEPEMCGNATRCAAIYLYTHHFWPYKKMILDTLSGPITTEIIDAKNSLVCVDMGAPRLMRAQIPMQGPAQQHAVEATLSDGAFCGTAVSMGNPHFVQFVPDVLNVDLNTVGPRVETHTDFPAKTNAEFVHVQDPHTLRMRVWERGAGITCACGTGSCAAAVAAVLGGRAQTPLRVILDGGELQITWDGQGPVYMTGPATAVFEGEYTEPL